MERLWQHFEQANNAAAMHSQAAWQYPLHLASQLHEKMDEEPSCGTVDIVVHKFQHLKRSMELDEFIVVDNPDVISFTPVLQSSTHYHGLGTNWYSFRVNYHSRSPSPLDTPTIPLVSLIPHSPSYHVTTPSPSPPLLSRIRSPYPPVIITGANQELINHLQRYAHPGPPFVKNWLDGQLCITMPITNANGNKGKAKYVQFLLNDMAPHALLTMGCGHPVYVVKLQAQLRNGAHSPFHPFRQRIFECNQPYQHLVNCALHTLGDPFIEGEVLQFRQLTRELLEAQ